MTNLAGEIAVPEDSCSPTESIIQLARELIRIPSQAGIDDPGPLLEHLDRWFTARGIIGELIEDDQGDPCAFLAMTPGTGPLLLLDACADTAPAGDPASWSHDPFSGEIIDGWLYGRGAGDSRMGISIFSHLFCESMQRSVQGGPGGRLGILFDADEHTGGFRGVRRFLDRHLDCAGVMIGYPGNEVLVRGARGFYRVTLTFHGTSAHSGQEEGAADNAVVKALSFFAAFGSAWERFLEGLTPDPLFPLGPRMTVTGVQGGGAWSVVPDTCRVSIDFRLTPTALREDVRELLLGELERCGLGDVAWDEMESWPPYHIAAEHPLCAAVTRAAEDVRGTPLPTIICGPSNIGNFLASHGIPALCGFGVTCEGYHAADERVWLYDIPPVYEIYRRAIDSLLFSR